MAAKNMRLQRIKQGAEALAFGNRLYALTLGAEAPQRLRFIPADPWPGNSQHGLLLCQEKLEFAGQIRGLAEWWEGPRDSSSAHYLHSFAWLRDLKAAGGDQARRVARVQILDWLKAFENWHEEAWQPHALGARLVNWLACYDFYCATADEQFRRRVFASIARQTRHLSRVLPSALSGSELITALQGLIYAGLALQSADDRFNQGLRWLEREVNQQIMPDGTHIERSPSSHLTVLQALVDVRTALKAARQLVPDSIQHAIDRLTPALRFFRHGDGGLALFNDSKEMDAALIDAVLLQADARGRPLRSAPYGGFERMMLGRSLLICDSGSPPQDGLNKHAHAGLLAFEFSCGRERIIVNCGSHPAQGQWRHALRSTAAHSALAIEQSDSARIYADGRFGAHLPAIRIERQDSGHSCLLSGQHDGYADRFGLLHQRRLFLGAAGEDLRGEDQLLSAGVGSVAAHQYHIRFHLHPDVQAYIAQSGSEAVLRLASGQVWRFKSDGIARLTIEDSVYFGGLDKKKRSQQLILSGNVDGAGVTIRWALRRDKQYSLGND